MNLRFQADADLDPEIGRGLRRREPSIDFQPAAGMLPDATPDFEVLQIAADAGRVLVSRDVTTMPGHFSRFIASNNSPGLILVPSARSIGVVIESLLTVWLNWSSEDMRNKLAGSRDKFLSALIAFSEGKGPLCRRAHRRARGESLASRDLRRPAVSSESGYLRLRAHWKRYAKTEVDNGAAPSRSIDALRDEMMRIMAPIPSSLTV